LIGRSSSRLGWNGFTAERHEVYPGVKAETSLEQHFVGVWTEPWHGEHRNLRGESVPISKRSGSVSLVPMGQVSPCCLSSPTEIMVIALEPEFIDSVEDELERRLTAPFLGKVAVDDPELSQLVSLLRKESDAGGLHGRIYAESLAHAIAVRFVHLARGERLRESLYRHASSPQSIRRVLDRLHDEFDVDLSLGALVGETGYSRRHFFRIFEDATGRTPHQYLLELKIKRAKELIQKTSMPLIDIAAKSGFSSQSHMSQIFRKYCGSTPGQIRRECTHSRTKKMCDEQFTPAALS
jgi:AraC family transcriptional regulator